MITDNYERQMLASVGKVCEFSHHPGFPADSTIRDVLASVGALNEELRPFKSKDNGRFWYCRTGREE